MLEDVAMGSNLDAMLRMWLSCAHEEVAATDGFHVFRVSHYGDCLAEGV